jgi:outer membrane lipoprotein-sorting protein
MRLFKSLVPLFCLVAVPLCGSGEPDAKALVSESAKSLFALGSYRVEQQASVDMQGGGMNNKMTMTTKMEAVPGKFRMDVSPMGVSVVSDGQATYFFLGQLNQYMKRPAVSSPEGVAESFMPGAGSMIDKVKNAITSANIIRQETIEVQGRKFDCYVVEALIGKITMTTPVPMTISNSHQTTWIDKDRKLALKQIADMEMQMGGSGGPMKMHQEMTVTTLDLEPAFKADEFTFVPPAGAKEVEELPGMPRLGGKN